MNKWRKRARKWKKLYGDEEEHHLSTAYAAEMVDQERDALLAWQWRVTEAVPGSEGVIRADTSKLSNQRFVWVTADDWDALCRAIESEPTASDFDRQTYLAQVEKWGKAALRESEPGKEET